MKKSLNSANSSFTKAPRITKFEELASTLNDNKSPGPGNYQILKSDFKTAMSVRSFDSEN